MSKYIKIGKRENNNKRGFLIVNPYLGKHIAECPVKVFGMFDNVAKLFPKNWNPKRTLVIGFAETATALGLYYACENQCLYMQTTRETVPGQHTYLYFSEEHSHATAQYILLDSLQHYVDAIDNIMFVDDEITTGKTVLNAIEAIHKAYPNKHYNYGVTSVLNSMDNACRMVYDEYDIAVYCLSHISNENYETQADACVLDGKHLCVSSNNRENVCIRSYTGLLDTRYIVDTCKYQKSLNRILDDLMATYKDSLKGKTVLVLGVEEFMYPGLVFAERIYKIADRVKFHATTRSPIAVSNTIGYPVHKRCEMDSVNEIGRNTYLYDVKSYDKVLVVCEAKYAKHDGLMQLANMLSQCGNDDIDVICL